MKPLNNYLSIGLISGRLQRFCLACLLVVLCTPLSGWLTAQNLLDKRINVSFDNEGVVQILENLEATVDVKFTYRSKLLANSQRITLDARDEALGDVLDRIFSPLRIKYDVVGGQIVLNQHTTASVMTDRFTRENSAPMLIKSEFALISGTVTDAESGTPLAGVTVRVKDASRGTTTNAQGRYTLDIQDADRVLVFSYTGFQTVEVAIEGRKVIDLQMGPNANTLDQVVVIGYGERTKKDLTGAVSVVGAEDIAKSVSVAPELAMQGRMAGVQVTTPGGHPGARPTVRIRGIGTFGNAEPLYVVDGVPLTEYGNGVETGGVGDIRGNVNVLTLINPNDIESISVLKDASASAIYGVRAANGVILITTKKGQKGVSRVEFNASMGVQNALNRYEVLDVPQFVSLYREAFANDPNLKLPAVFGKDSVGYLGGRTTVDWQDPFINKNAAIQDYSMKISGGNDKTTYYLSGGYSYNESSVVQNNLKRYTFAGNLNTRVSRFLSVGTTYRFSYVDALDNTGFGTDLRYLAQTSPWQPIFNPDGTFAPSVAMTFKRNNSFNANDLGSGAAFDIDQTNLLWGPETNANIFARQALSETRFGITRNLGTGYIEFEPLRGLRFRGTLGIDYFTNIRTQFTDINDYLYSQTPGNPFAGHDGTSKGNYGERVSRNYNQTREFSVNYVKTLRQHRFDVLLNAMDQRYTYRFLGASTNQLPFTVPNLRGVGGLPQFNDGGSFFEENALQGYMGRLSYSFAGKYYLDATIRRDGSSRFAPEYRWGTFPSVAAAWRISAEKFLQNNSLINDLKLRVGWGQLGNQETSSFAFLSKVSFSPDYAFGSGNGNSVGALTFGARFPDQPNPLLSWETAETSNIGLDGTVLDSRLNFTVEWYNRLTKGILQASQLAPSVGNENNPIINVASVQNRGMEFQLGWQDQIGKFSYGFNGNLTTVNNKVVGLYQDAPFGGEGGRIEIGKPLFYLWGYEVGGVLRDQAAVDAYKAQTEDLTNGGRISPGDLFYKDVNQPDTENPNNKTGVMPGADGKISAADRTMIGNVIPGFFYGFGGNVGYGAFDLSVFFQGVGDVQQYNGERASGECMCGNGANMWTSTLNRWTPQNPNSTMPRAIQSDPANNSRFSNRFVESAAFLRLKNVQLGFTLPKSANRKVGVISNLRFYLSGSNLLTFTKWTGIDPEAQNISGIIPPVRTYLAGVNAAF
jgi:TonB-dependent starch-binding outer membrane protein SusC